TALAGWVDITSDVETSNTPFTLARSDGVGAIQFSTAEFVGGKLPNITLNDLGELLVGFAASKRLGVGYDPMATHQPVLIIARSFDFGPKFLRVWYCSNGRDIALVTYVCEKGLQASE